MAFMHPQIEHGAWIDDERLKVDGATVVPIISSAEIRDIDPRQGPERLRVVG